MTTPNIRKMCVDDMSELSVLQAKVWKDYFRIERNLEVPLVRRSDTNLRYYLGKEPDGCFVAEKDSEIVGCIFTHIWGKVGWFGPVEVKTEMQGRGIGKGLIEESVRYMESRGCETIGLETMASSVKNLGIYEQFGFTPKDISSVYYKKLAARTTAPEGAISVLTPSSVADCRELWQTVMPGLDYTVEFAFTTKHELGSIFGLDTNGGLAHAIVHTYGMFENSHNAIIKLVTAPTGETDAAAILMSECERVALDNGCTGMFIRSYDATPPSNTFFTERGYALQSRSTRMMLTGEDEGGDTIHVSCWSG